MLSFDEEEIYIYVYVFPWYSRAASEASCLRMPGSYLEQGLKSGPPGAPTSRPARSQ